MTKTEIQKEYTKRAERIYGSLIDFSRMFPQHSNALLGESAYKETVVDFIAAALYDEHLRGNEKGSLKTARSNAGDIEEMTGHSGADARKRVSL